MMNGITRSYQLYRNKVIQSSQSYNSRGEGVLRK